MSELYFLPTPNWFISRPLDIYNDETNVDNPQNGIVALSVIGSIYFIDYKFKSFYNCIKLAHLKRINALSFKKSKLEENICLLASCSDDLEVKVWDVNTRVLLKQHQLHQNIPTCLDWLDLDSGNELILISGDIKGNLFKWNVNTNANVRYFPENKPITQLKSCKNQYLIAIGYKHGTIVIMNIQHDQMKIVYKLKSHEDAINYLYWYPAAIMNDQLHELNTSFNYVFENVNDNSLILCSSSEDKTIRLWSIEKGIEIIKLNTPGMSNSNKSQQKINFTPLCWPTSRYLVSASYNGDLFVFDLNSKENPTMRWAPFNSFKSDRAHRKCIYDISYYNNTIITLSVDKLINIWNFKALNQENSLSTLNGFVYSIVSSPIDSRMLAISIGDSSIKVFYETNSIDRNIKTFSNNIKTEVTQIAWHPNKESIIAFGTKDGKVGIIDISSTNKPAHYIYTHYNQSVYTLVWSQSLLGVSERGSLSPTESMNIEQDESIKHKQKKQTSNFVLYSVAEGKIMQHSFRLIQHGTVSNCETINFYNELKARISINEAESSVQSETTNQQVDTGLTEIAILNANSNIVYFTIGKFDGSIELYKCNYDNNQLYKLCTLLNHNKLITIIKWNINSNYMASGSNDFNVIIVDFKLLIESLIDKNDKNNANLKFISKYRHKLVGHKERITGLSWSLHNENMLASCSYDSTVQIWDVLNGTPISNYRGHGDKVLCCLFSTIDQNKVFSAGEDYALHLWDMNKQIHKLPPDECLILTGKKKKQHFKKANKKPEKIEVTCTTESLIIASNEPGGEEEQEEIIKPTQEEVINKIEEAITEIETIKSIEIRKIEIVQESSQIEKSFQKLQLSTNVPKKQIEIGTCFNLKIKDYKQLFPLSSKAHRLNRIKSLIDCLVLFETIYENPGLQSMTTNSEINEFNEQFELIDLNFNLNNNYANEKQFINLYLFGNRKSTIKMLIMEQNELLDQNSPYWWLFDIFKGNIEKLMHELETRNELNDFFLTLYQCSIQPNLYTENSFFKNYLNSLLSKGEFHKVALYLIALYKINDAIDVYLRYNQYQFALCLAQLRLNKSLSENNYIFNDILFKYALYSAQNGDYETGVLAYIRIKDLINASKTLIRRTILNDEHKTLINNLMSKFSKYDATLCVNTDENTSEQEQN